MGKSGREYGAGKGTGFVTFSVNRQMVCMDRHGGLTLRETESFGDILFQTSKK